MKDPHRRAKLSADRRGKKANISPEALAARNAKIAEANRRRKLSPQARKNMSDAQRAKGRAERFAVEGELLTAMDVSERYPVSRHTFIKRVRSGWDPTVAATTPVRKLNRG